MLDDFLKFRLNDVNKLLKNSSSLCFAFCDDRFVLSANSPNATSSSDDRGRPPLLDLSS